ncbi:class IV adenylate cyclase [Nocardia cyriacigeorgica]|uniref:Class IV adenylate cyclase n=1 Tax=Nocardia cyriacigeorgica TaxID=135487 RepID=A0A5R8NNY6_9NOCA|nr:class IV adenylate cyclase [Nocardia cyriacigeorgica]TLF77406.1 class IV adenylate cyclase [Nocardia cyriacigeorgica]
MIEAEYKARLVNPAGVRKLLADRADAERVEYRDTYFDDAERSLSRGGRECRLRTITGPDGARHLLTFKDPTVDSATGSKPEFETVIGDRAAMEQIIARLGLRAVISFSKACENFRFVADGRQVLATLVSVPELDGQFLELETMVSEEAELPEALRHLESLLAELGVSADELTTELYTDAVARRRDSGR